MTKMTFALAAALLAGTTMTSVANAGAIRVGFGFPLGSFVAHSNESYGARDYDRAQRPRTIRSAYRDDAPVRKIVKVKRPVRTDVADAAVKAPVVRTAKLEGKLASDPATTTVIAKTPVSKSDATPANVTTGSITPASTNSSVSGKKIADADKPSTEKADAATTTAATETKHVCRRYVPAIAALVDVPCE